MPKPPSFSPRKLTELYVQRAFHELSTKFLEVIRYFEETAYQDLDEPTCLRHRCVRYPFRSLVLAGGFRAAPSSDIRVRPLQPDDQQLGVVVALENDRCVSRVDSLPKKQFGQDPHALFGPQPGAF